MNWSFFGGRPAKVGHLLVQWLLAGGCVMWIGASTAEAQISGHVFRDLNHDGQRGINAPFAEPGVANVLVAAYVEGSNSPVVVGTDQTGRYSFGVVDVPPTKRVRLEFYQFPAFSQEGPTPGASAVQFRTAPFDGANLPLTDPLTYCQTDPELVTPCYVNGDSQANGSTGASLPTLVGYPFSSSGQGIPSPVYRASARQTGAVWATAWQRQSARLFSATILKRHSGFGPLGLGGLYVTDPQSQTSAAYADLDKFLTLSAHADSIALRSRSLPASYSMTSNDPDAFRLAGKTGLGGMTFSPNEDTLWVINLYEKTLVSINIGLPAKAGSSLQAADFKSYPIPNLPIPNQPNTGDFRPWAVTYHEGKLYVGVVNDAAITRNRADLSACVYGFDLKTKAFNPTPVVKFSLNYKRGVVHAQLQQSDHWESWTDNWSDLMTSPFISGTGASVTTLFTRVARPQPILADIDFDTDGSMVLGLMDRTGHQTGRNQPAVPNDGEIYTGYTGGDLLRVFNNNGTFTLEANAAGTSTGGTSLTGCGPDNQQGPGGGEFYCDDQYLDLDDNPIQSETFMGSAVLLAGIAPTVAANVVNPFTTWSAGTAWFDNQIGSLDRRYEVYRDEPQGASSGVPPTFGKANGLGSLQPLCSPAPLEIGNRVWEDTNKDGVQDAAEPPVGGVQVSLLNATGQLLATTVTDDNGQYVFSSTSTSALTYNQNYALVFGTAGSASQLNPANQLVVNRTIYAPARANQGQGQLKSGNDSNAQTSMLTNSAFRNYPTILLKTGGPGQNNYSYDAGFERIGACPPTSCLTIGVTVIRPGKRAK